jgi:heme/copper-type cytochrome/quinol oxidase subunit 4
MQKKKKIIRATTVPTSLDTFCREQLRELNERYEVVAVSSPLPELDAVATREGVRTIAVKMERHISPWSDLKSFVTISVILTLMALVIITAVQQNWDVFQVVFTLFSSVTMATITYFFTKKKDEEKMAETIENTEKQDKKVYQ